ncbi:hypothetical protein [Streptomyces sp. NPDC007940]|uniref:hypothetical protein n=1 Tax=Streptomyces sp. NPDC007940 TaxID=3364796 RepID=UPI0036F0078C
MSSSRLRTFVAGHEALTASEFVELALGTPVELWLGAEGESESERAARLDAARDILADNPEMPDDLIRIAAEVVETHPELFNVVPLARQAGSRRPSRKGAAA